ncbi:MAG: type II CAAX endopeptidase family protein [Proteobacteria bacterium]|nr:type II CAAX endopeptidase family protein [Pseudomonadota bacterium]MDA1059699.1 type II CAAX endopeptidase family protein [Pseudomonadota bacterium]
MPRAVPVALFAALTVPFFVNDIGFILAATSTQWLAVDYGSKALAIIAVFAVPSLRAAVVRGAAWPSLRWSTVGGTIGIVVLTIATFSWLDESGLDATTALQTFLPIEQPWLVAFDLTVGLALTAIAEEIVFRRLFLDALGTRLPVFSLYAVSATLFAGIHWSNGLGTIAGAFLVGLLLIWLTRRAGTVIPAVVAHFFINLVLFWP